MSRNVRVGRGQTVTVNVRAGVCLEVLHAASGAVTIRNANTGSIVRSWAPKDRDGRKGGRS